MENDDLLSEFLADIDVYYEQAAKGINLMESSDISAGIDLIFRPLHTIKGTSGFIEGLEVVSKFTHKVEDYLKRVQSNEIPSTPQIINLITRAVETVFNLLDQARSGEKIENTVGWEILENIEKILHPASSVYAENIVVEDKDNIHFVRIGMARVHLPGQYLLLTETFNGLEKGKQVVLDLSRVRSIGSTAWGAILEACKKTNVSVIGMNETCRTIFYVWGFNKIIKDFKSEEDFWNNRLLSAAL